MPNKQKRVLLIAPQPFFVNRGTPINVRAMAEVLSSGGYQVDLLTYHCGEELEISGVRHFRSFALPWVSEVPIGPSYVKILLDFFLSLRALQLLFTRQIDVVHGVEEGGCIAGLFAPLRGLPYIFDMDSCMPDQLEKSGFFRSKFILSTIASIERFFIRRASAVFTVCTALTEKAREYAPDGIIYQAEDFPSESSLVVNAGLLAELKEDFSIRDEERIVLYTGNFEPYQGMELLLRSYASFLKSNSSRDLPPTRLILVGGGSEDSPLRKTYELLSQELGIREKVVFAGSRAGEQMGTFMALADVLASPRTEGENTPLKIYGYMAAGKPVLATRIRSHTQVLGDDSAFLALPEVEEFSEALFAALTDEEKRQVVVNKAKGLIAKKYNRDVFERSLLAMYSEVAGGLEK